MNKKVKLSILILILCICKFSRAQTFNYYIANDHLLSSTIFEFDVFIQNTSGSDFKFRSTIQCFTFNPAFINGASITPSLVSTALANYSLSSITWSAAANGFQTNQNNAPLSCSNGTVIPASGTPVRIATYRLTAASPGFFGCAPGNPNMVMNGDIPAPSGLALRMSVVKWTDATCVLNTATTITGSASQYTRYPSQTQYSLVNNDYTTDNNLCTSDACNPANGNITHTQIFPDDHNACTLDACDPVLGNTFTPINFNDNNACTNDLCDPLTGPYYTLVNPNDNDPATNDGCDPATGVFHIYKMFAAIPFQAAARNNAGTLLTNQNISLRFSIHTSAPGGTIVYQETHFLTTSGLGLFTANIGLGNVISGIFETIDWGTSAKFIQVEMDAAGGSSFIDLGTQQMLSVPYALNAANGNFNNSGNDIYNSNSGNVGIGVTSPSQKLHVSGNGLFSGTITASCGTLTCSDYRYKKSIKPMENSLNNLCKINGVSYYFKKAEFPGMNFNDNKQIGIIAQELETIYPELVYTDSDGYKSVDYSKLTPVLIEAIKELKKENEILKSNNAVYKTEISKIKRQLGIDLKAEN